VYHNNRVGIKKSWHTPKCSVLLCSKTACCQIISWIFLFAFYLFLFIYLFFIYFFIYLFLFSEKLEKNRNFLLAIAQQHWSTNPNTFKLVGSGASPFFHYTLELMGGFAVMQKSIYFGLISTGPKAYPNSIVPLVSGTYRDQPPNFCVARFRGSVNLNHGLLDKTCR